MSALFSIGSRESLATLPWVLVLTIGFFLLLARVGLVAAIATQFVVVVLIEFPFTWPPTGWYSGVGFVGVAVTAALAVAAFYVATGADRPARPPVRASGVRS